jgi:hypothetical protein
MASNLSLTKKIVNASLEVQKPRLATHLARLVFGFKTQVFPRVSGGLAV